MDDVKGKGHRKMVLERGSRAHHGSGGFVGAEKARDCLAQRVDGSCDRSVVEMLDAVLEGKIGCVV